MNATRQDEWIVTDGMGEHVQYYNPTGHVMVFTKNRDEARRTTDSYEAYEIARIARELYKRRFMKIGMA